jgi:putative membrane protein
LLIRNFLNGLAFGVTETVPGVSGSTIAIILGFYDELIETVNHFTENVRKYMAFLLPLLLGVATGLVAFSSIVTYLLANHSFPTMAFFIGLIIGIIPLIYTRARDGDRQIKHGQIPLILAPIILLVVIANVKGVSVVNPAEIIPAIDPPYMAFILLAGIIAAAALVIPSVSGSFMLLLLGIYPLVTYSVASLRFLLTDITNMGLWWDILKVLLPLGIGIVIGGLAMARLIERLLKNHYKTVYSIILGLLIGSVYTLFKEPIMFQSGLSAGVIALGIFTCVLGCAASFTLGRKKL